MSLTPIKVVKECYAEDHFHIIKRAYEALDWWSYLIDIEYPRFIATLPRSENNDRNEVESNPYIPEKMLFITVVHHCINSINYLVKYLQSIGDHSLDILYHELNNNQTLKDFRHLRNMNEHKEDYLDGKGRRQDQFVFQTISFPSIKDSFNIDGHSTRIGPEAKIQLWKLDVEDIMFLFKANISAYRKWIRDLMMQVPKMLIVETWDQDEETGDRKNYKKETIWLNKS